MKKIISIAFAAVFGFSLFAADIFTYVPLNSDIRSYTKTDFSIASKFGNYFRTPSLKTKHSFENGKEVSSSEMTPKDLIQNSISSIYDENGRLREQSYTNSDSEIVWKNLYSYNSDGLKSEISEYDTKNSLKSKTLFIYDRGNLVDETTYDGEGALLWKTIYKYTPAGAIETICEYSADGKLSNQETYAYTELGQIDSITIFDTFDNTEIQKVFRYGTENQLGEITTYDNSKQVSNRLLIKYDADGNVARISEYNVAEKFGTIVNELIGMSEYSYEF